MNSLSVTDGDVHQLSVSAAPFTPLSAQWRGGPNSGSPLNQSTPRETNNGTPTSAVWNTKESFNNVLEVSISSECAPLLVMGENFAVPVFVDVPLKASMVEESIDIFESVRPQGYPNVELRLYYYSSQIRTAKAYYGKISSRKADVTLRNVALDVPPLCFSRIIEHIVNNVGKLIAIHFSESDGPHFDIWLDKAGTAGSVAEKLSNSLWTLPMGRGYAVYLKGPAERTFFKHFSETFSSNVSGDEKKFPILLVNAKKN